MTDNATPWRLHLVDSSAIIGSDGECVAEIQGDYKHDWQRMEANAALIVRAVNAHQDMIAALQECEEYLADREDVVDGSYGIPAPNKAMSLLQEVRAALAKAGAP